MASPKENPRKTEPEGKRHRPACPLCEKPVDMRGPAASKHFPFCSRRCKLIDLGKWFDGEHRISIPIEDDDE